MEKSNRKTLFNSLIVFLIVCIPKVILCFHTIPLSIPSDEIATMSAGAWAAGLDWSAVISHAGYYGSGMTIFTAPIYYLTDNPMTIYRFTGIFCAFLQSIPAVIAYLSAKKFFYVKDMAAVLIGIVSGYFVMTRAHVIFNEHAMILVSWIIMVLVLQLHKNVQSPKKKAFYTLLLMVVLGWSMTLHTRSLTYWIALVILVPFYFICYKQWIVSVPVAIGGGVIGWLLSQSVVSYMKEILWSVGSGASVRNGQISIGGGLETFFHLKDIRPWLSIILGQIHTIGVYTCGFALLFFVAFICVLFRFLFFKKNRYELKRDSVISYSVPIMVFFLAAVMITIAGQSITWLGGSVAVYEGGPASQEYGIKAYGYLRYFGNYCGPLLMLGMIWMVQRKDLILQYFKPTFVIMVLVEIYWIVCIVPYVHLCKEVGVLEYYLSYLWYSLDKPFRYLSFMPASAIMFAVIILGYICVGRKKSIICFGILAIVFINTYMYLGIEWDIRFARGCNTWANDGYRVIREVEQTAQLPETIYVEDLWEKADHNNFFMYQFLLNHYEVIPERPDEGLQEAILFSNAWVEEGVYDEMLSDGYKYAYVGDYEILLVKGGRLQNVFEESGIALLDK